jgi:predicted transglutaminase-like cysteine proteinase
MHADMRRSEQEEEVAMTLTVLDPRSVRTLTDRSRLRTVRRCLLAMAASVGLMAFEPAAAKSPPLGPTILPPATEAILSDGPAGPTPAWTAFCMHRPEECAVDPSAPPVLTLTPDLWLAIGDVNERVNRTILAVTDQDHWGVPDRWDYPEDGLGDCEDIQLLKRKLLIEAGVSRRALPMTVVIDEQGAGHAVLMVRTDRGDFILDNKRDAVLAWYETGYHYVKREGDDGGGWVWLGGEPVPTATATR